MNTVLGGLGITQGTMENMYQLDDALGKLGFVKGVQLAGNGLFIVQSSITISSAYEAWQEEDSNKLMIGEKAFMDIVAGAAMVWGGPVGFAAGGLYFILDASGTFEKYGFSY